MKILAVTYAFPPMASPRSVQIARIIESLYEHNIMVICADDVCQRKDETIWKETKNLLRIKVRRIRFRRNFALRALDSIFYRIGITPWWSNIPDKYRGWALAAFGEFSSQKMGYPLGDDFHHPDILLTFGQPMSVHLFGLMLKRKMNIKWIAHFSDPWTDNLYRKDGWISAPINKKLEKAVIERSDAVIFTSPETRQVVMKKYDSSCEKKMYYLPHCFDPMLYDEKLQPPPVNDKYVIRHIGAFYGQRSPIPLLEAIKVVYHSSPELLKNVVFEFVGPMDIFNLLLLSRSGEYRELSEFINVRKPVTYLESIRLMQTSHCLLLVDAASDFSVFFPSKLADYIGSNRFIFAITPLNGAASRIVKDTGGAVADPADIKQIAAMLENILIKKPYQLNGAKAADMRRNFARQKVGGDFIKIIDDVMKL